MACLKNSLFRTAFIASGILVSATSCHEQSGQEHKCCNTQAKMLSVNLTTEPCQYDSIRIDLRCIEVKLDTVKAHWNDDHYGDMDNDEDDDLVHMDEYGYWDTLKVTPGPYNILQAKNKKESLIGSAVLPAGKIRKVRITIGKLNSLVKTNVNYPLSLIPVTNNYVYVKVHADDEYTSGEGKTALWINLNACKNLRLINGQYYFKPRLALVSNTKEENG